MATSSPSDKQAVPIATQGPGTHLRSASLLVKKPALAALLISILIVIAHSAVDWLLQHWGGSQFLVYEASNVILGLVAFVLLLQLFRYNRQRRVEILQRLEVIDEMNHHIRNALQVISFNARPAMRREFELEEIDQAVSRIHWTLREVLPKMEPQCELFESSLHPKPPQPSPPEERASNS